MWLTVALLVAVLAVMYIWGVGLHAIWEATIPRFQRWLWRRLGGQDDQP